MQSCDPLRDVRVDFTILRRSGQIFSFYKSFYALFNNHRARQEPRSQLLGHLTGHNQTIIRNLQIQFLKQTSHKEHTLTSATSTLCCIFFLDFMMRTMAASISCFLSSSTFCRVSLRSGSDSPCLAATAGDGFKEFVKRFSKNVYI